MPTRRFEDHREHCDRVREAVLEAVRPERALREHWPADLPERVFLIAVGKAAHTMLPVGVELLGERLAGGIAVVLPEAAEVAAQVSDRVEVCPGAHPLPDERNLRAAEALEAFCDGLPGGAGVVVLLSGGGSAMLTAPAEGVSLEDVRRVTEALNAGGADIAQLNAVRKHIDRLKGGRLARRIAGRVGRVGGAGGVGRVVQLVLSDVLGDRMDTIASGPLAPDPTTFAEARRVLDAFGLAEAYRAVAAHLERGVRGEVEETPKEGDPAFAAVETRIIAGNGAAIAAAGRALEGLGFSVETEGGVVGEAAEAGRRLAARVVGLRGRAPAAVVFGGETVVRVGASGGKGGRNQELALAAGLALAGEEGVCVMALATDGVDGPTDAAGAVVTGRTAGEAAARGVDLAGALARHDAHPALDRLGALIRTGATGTNVNDVYVGMVYG